MHSERIFTIAIVISLGIHIAILVQNPNFSIFHLRQKEEAPPEVSYIKQKKEPPETKKNTAISEPFLKLSSKITADKRNPPPFIDTEGAAAKKITSPLPKPALDKPLLIKSDIVAIKKKITLPAVELDKINNPSYISYYQIVREKIRRAAYQNYTRTQTGEVYISFIISADGYLQEARLSEDRSSDDPYLREIALRSVKDASPFPNFPKELDYPQLSFNIEISFDLE